MENKWVFRCALKTVNDSSAPTLGNRVWLPLLFYFWLFTLSQKKQSVIHLPTPLENATTCEVPKFFLSDWRFALYWHFPYLRFPPLQIRTCVFQYLRFQRPRPNMFCFLPVYNYSTLSSLPSLFCQYHRPAKEVAHSFAEINRIQGSHRLQTLPRCYHLGSYFTRTSFSFHHIRRGIKLSANMTSSTKPEVPVISPRRQRRTEPRPIW